MKFNVRTPRPRNAREKRLLAAFATVALGTYMYIELIEPRIESWMQLRHELTDVTEEYQRLSLLVEHEDEIRARYAQLTDDFGNSDSGANDAIDFYHFLAASEGGESFHVLDLRPVLSRRTGPGAQQASVTLLAEGNVDGLERFLRRMTSTDQPLRIESLSFSLARQGGPLSISATVSRSIEDLP